LGLLLIDVTLYCILTHLPNKERKAVNRDYFYSDNISVASDFHEVLLSEPIIPSLAYDFEKKSNALAPKCQVPITDHDGSNHN
jgi:hypothetical protein